MKTKYQETCKALVDSVMLFCRWPVLWFAAKMENTLRYNETYCGKQGWKQMTDKEILTRIRQETRELAKAKTIKGKIQESVDIANFAMFFAARYKDKD